VTITTNNKKVSNGNQDVTGQDIGVGRPLTPTLSPRGATPGEPQRGARESDLRPVLRLSRLIGRG
jgi:hypothetical protein